MKGKKIINKKTPLSSKLQITGLLITPLMYFFTYKLHNYGIINAKMAVIAWLWIIPLLFLVTMTMAVYFYGLEEKKEEKK